MCLWSKWSVPLRHQLPPKRSILGLFAKIQCNFFQNTAHLKDKLVTDSQIHVCANAKDPKCPK